MNYQEPNSPTASTTAEQISGAATQAWETTQEKAREALHTGERYVRDNPGTSALSIFGFGVLVGALIGYSIAHEDHEDYSASTRKMLKRLSQRLNLD